MSAPRWNRKWHRIGAIVTSVPVLVIFVTGVFLQLKKDWGWVQPPTMRSADPRLEAPWEEILAAARGVAEAEVRTWDDIERLDVRPDRGIVKVTCVNRWELQLDAGTAEVLSSTYRRSDLIESLHDGSWFHDSAKLWIFLPTSIVLLGLWASGMYLWLLPYLVKRRKRAKAAGGPG